MGYVVDQIIQTSLDFSKKVWLLVTITKGEKTCFVIHNFKNKYSNIRIGCITEITKKSHLVKSKLIVIWCNESNFKVWILTDFLKWFKSDYCSRANGACGFYFNWVLSMWKIENLQYKSKVFDGGFHFCGYHVFNSILAKYSSGALKSRSGLRATLAILSLLWYIEIYAYHTVQIFRVIK